MAISTIDQLVDALANRSQPIVLNKGSLGNATAGAFHSLWRATGTPGQGAIPTTPAVCDKTLTGALLNFSAPGGSNTLYLARLCALSSNSATDITIADRLAHMGGLVGNVTTSQTVGLDLSGVASGRYASDLSDVQWFLEWYTDTGGTASNATVAVTYDDDSTGNLATIAVGGTVRASRMLALQPAVAGRRIKSVDSVTLSASTGSAGNFGVTAYKFLTNASLGLANSSNVSDWAALGIPRVHPDACLTIITFPGTTSTGTLVGTARLIDG